MPFTFKPYDPPPLSNIRERLLLSKLDRVDSYVADREAALQVAIERGSVSRSYIAVNQQELNSFRDLRENLRDGLETIRRQDAAEQKLESERKAAIALDPVRERKGFFRSSNERNAAILGFLERERRQNAPLTREAWSRAQAIAASRRSYDPESSQLRGRRGSEYSPSASDLAGSDPCVDYEMASRSRREVMFANGSAGVGYRVRHKRRKPWWC